MLSDIVIAKLENLKKLLLRKNDSNNKANVRGPTQSNLNAENTLISYQNTIKNILSKVKVETNFFQICFYK